MRPQSYPELPTVTPSYQKLPRVAQSCPYMPDLHQKESVRSISSYIWATFASVQELTNRYVLRVVHSCPEMLRAAQSCEKKKRVTDRGTVGRKCSKTTHIGGKKITRLLAPLTLLRSVPRCFAPLHSAPRAPLHSAPLRSRRS